MNSSVFWLLARCMLLIILKIWTVQHFDQHIFESSWIIGIHLLTCESLLEKSSDCRIVCSNPENKETPLFSAVTIHVVCEPSHPLHSQDLNSNSPVCHKILIMLVWRICYASTNNPLIDIFFYFHHLSPWCCIDIVMRNSVLVTLES